LVRIQQEQTRPMSMALRILPRLMYGPDHPYGQPLTGSGTPESVQAISRDDVVAFHDTWFRPNNATLIVVGDIDQDELTAKLEDLLGNWQPGEFPQKNLDVQTPALDAGIVYVLDRPGADQSVIFAGQLIPPQSNPDELAIQAANRILGGQSSARVNMNLREDKGWSYGAFSAIVGARGERPLLVYAPVQTDKTADSIIEIRNEITAFIGDEPPTAEELELAKDSQTLSLPGRWEASGDVLRSLGELVRYGLPDDYWSTFAGRIKALELDDVAAIARTVVEPDDMLWVVVGDRTKIEAELSGLGFEEIRPIDSEGRPAGMD